MALYEHVFLARQDLSQAQVDALAAQATEIIEKNDGKVTKTETWGLKNLAYKIDRNRKAHFVMLNIEGPGSVVAELERQTRINEDVLRFLTIKVEEHEEGPSVMMRKNDRDRKRRGDN
ncbi:30S ribosomal protein S6 [Pseudoblastomonas halimionae]|uniref:Small ribosomal subunit protein bS6 n=1 Tax=Alteriqipengyuania halimionae TaxID=1926630 RepID=A0A6I4U487_9SPHN|nr:30S ribosomal protein S6 [Alteriqipengyuania halimionae]MXP09733.1 30S ribosomal protein S6 [Alteriqipengyuania halimionae]